jgi:NAD(P)-dependent dehydrogenase (short-subunit alcohol dehydrogenase family)
MRLVSLQDQYRAVVFGGSGGIGGALVRLLAADPGCAVVHAGMRRVVDAQGKVRPFRFELTEEDSIAAFATALEGEADLVLVATGVLHDAALKPEKTYRALAPEALARSFAVNAIGPALIAKHLLPRLPRTRKSVFGVVSARVGSISDNRSGGWHAYRAAKAALNQLVRTCAIELAARNAHALCVALHPGTVDTAMSKPFQAGVPPERLFTPETSAQHLLAVIDRLDAAANGGFFAWDGQPIPF